MVKKNVDLPKAVGDAIRAIRSSQGLSQEKLAAKAGVDRAYMGSIERGLRNPSLATIGRVAAGLGVPISEIFTVAERDFADRRRGK